MTWRDAKAIDRLQAQINERFPNRSIASDGTIGDESHRSRNSDHNAWIRGRDGKWIVSALDITHDPKHGLDCHVLAQQLIDSRDPRIKYIIWNRRIISGRDGPAPWQWRTYLGHSHSHHMHLSVEDTEERYDDASDWKFRLAPTTHETSAPPTPSLPKLRSGMTGVWVKQLQIALNEEMDARLLVDGDFGPKTDRAVRIFQKEKGLVADGVVGQYTWNKLNVKQELK